MSPQFSAAQRNNFDEILLRSIQPTNVNVNGLLAGLPQIQWSDTALGTFVFTSGILPAAFRALIGAGIVANVTYPEAFKLASADKYLEASMDWMTFVNEALKDSRPMTDWERKVAAESFWSEFD
jgi:hypothetical protein